MDRQANHCAAEVTLTSQNCEPVAQSQEVRSCESGIHTLSKKSKSHLEILGDRRVT